MTPEDKTKSLSASIFRQLWLLKAIEVENQFFYPQFAEGSKGKVVAKHLNNNIVNIRTNLDLIRKNLPMSERVIDEQIDSEKIPYISSIVEKLSYMTIEQLEMTDNAIELKAVEQ